MKPERCPLEIQGKAYKPSKFLLRLSLESQHTVSQAQSSGAGLVNMDLERPQNWKEKVPPPTETLVCIMWRLTHKYPHGEATGNGQDTRIDCTGNPFTTHLALLDISNTRLHLTWRRNLEEHTHTHTQAADCDCHTE